MEKEESQSRMAKGEAEEEDRSPQMSFSPSLSVPREAANDLRLYYGKPDSKPGSGGRRASPDVEVSPGESELPPSAIKHVRETLASQMNFVKETILGLLGRHALPDSIALLNDRVEEEFADLEQQLNSLVKDQLEHVEMKKGGKCRVIRDNVLDGSPPTDPGNLTRAVGHHGGAPDKRPRASRHISQTMNALVAAMDVMNDERHHSRSELSHYTEPKAPEEGESTGGRGAAKKRSKDAKRSTGSKGTDESIGSGSGGGSALIQSGQSRSISKIGTSSSLDSAERKRAAADNSPNELEWFKDREYYWETEHEKLRENRDVLQNRVDELENLLGLDAGQAIQLSSGTGSGVGVQTSTHDTAALAPEGDMSNSQLQRLSREGVSAESDHPLGKDVSFPELVATTATFVIDRAMAWRDLLYFLTALLHRIIMFIPAKTTQVIARMYAAGGGVPPPVLQATFNPPPLPNNAWKVFAFVSAVVALRECQAARQEREIWMSGNALTREYLLNRARWGSPWLPISLVNLKLDWEQGSGDEMASAATAATSFGIMIVVALEVGSVWDRLLLQIKRAANA